MRAVWKYQISMGRFSLQMPEDAQILRVDQQGGQGQMWALIDPHALIDTRTFRVYGTGHAIEEEGLTYIGTFSVDDGLLGELVWHVFEERGGVEVD